MPINTIVFKNHGYLVKIAVFAQFLNFKFALDWKKEKDKINNANSHKNSPHICTIIGRRQEVMSHVKRAANL